MVFGKVLLGSFGAVAVTSALVPPFRRKLDRNILRPIRNYNEHLNEWNEFKTEVGGFWIEVAYRKSSTSLWDSWEGE